MGIDEFLNTKLSGVLFAIAMLIGDGLCSDITPDTAADILRA